MWIAGSHLLRHGADGLLDGDRWIHPMQVPEVDMVGMQSAQAAIDSRTGVICPRRRSSPRCPRT